MSRCIQKHPSIIHDSLSGCYKEDLYGPKSIMPELGVCVCVVVVFVASKPPIYLFLIKKYFLRVSCKKEPAKPEGICLGHLYSDAAITMKNPSVNSTVFNIFHLHANIYFCCRRKEKWIGSSSPHR